MLGYGQFCPVAQALEVVGERWSLLIVRELLCGDYRFGELMHGLPLISRSVLAQRLRALEASGIVERDGSAYRLTAQGRELDPVVRGLGAWGQRWTKGKFDAKDLDPVLMMWDLRRHLDVERLPEAPTVVSFWYRDMPAKRSRYWLRIERPEVDLCLTNPGFEVQLSIETTLRTMVDVWMGHRDLREALQTRAIELAGTPGLVKTFPRWLLLSPFAKVERAVAV